MLTIGAVLISFSPVFVKLANVGPTVTSFYRLLFGSILLVAIVVFGRLKLPTTRSLRVWLALCGLLFAIDLSVWHRSIPFIGPGLSTLLGNFQVFLMAACGVIFFREKLGWRLAVAVPMSILGLSLIFGRDWSMLQGEYGVGVFFGLLTAFTYTAYLLTLRKAQGLKGAPSPIVALAMISISGALFAAGGSFSFGESFVIPDLQSLWALTMYGLISQVVGWVLIARAMPKVEASRIGLVLLLQPALALVWDYLFFAKPVFLIEVLGLGIVLLAIYLGSRR